MESNIIYTKKPTPFMRKLSECRSVQDIKNIEKMTDDDISLVNQRNALYYTPLTYVCHLPPYKSIRYKLITLLIDKGANINFKTKDGRNALSNCYGNIIKMKLLLQRGAKVNDALFRHKDVDVIKLLLEYITPQELNLKKNNINALFHHISSKSDIKIIKMLIDKGIELKCTADSGFTTLQIAIYYYSEVVNILLGCGYVMEIKEMKTYITNTSLSFEKCKMILDNGYPIDEFINPYATSLFSHITERMKKHEVKKLLDYVIENELPHSPTRMMKNLSDEEELGDYYVGVCLERKAMKKVIGMLCMANSCAIPNEMMYDVVRGTYM